MTNEEARDICVMALRCFGIKHNSLLTTGAKDEMIKQIAENFDIRFMLEALEKQIPKKPINPIDEDGFTVFWNCPECDIQNTGDVEYCPHCGQRIDWTEEERSCSNCKWNGTKCYEAPEGLKCNDCTQWRAIDWSDDNDLRRSKSKS